jgi:hypothetical protein
VPSSLARHRRRRCANRQGCWLSPPRESNPQPSLCSTPTPHPPRPPPTLQTRTIAISKATLYLLTSIALVPSGKAALTSSSAASAILSSVAQFSKQQDFVFKAYAKECLQVRPRADRVCAGHAALAGGWCR